jgi:thiol-disulfide isomerase/thioredoxin
VDGWLNSTPLSLAGLRGRVVLVEFWTYGCSNCRNTLPWVKQVAVRYRDEVLVVVAVHTPEFPRERQPGNVARAVRPRSANCTAARPAPSASWRTCARP